MTSKQNWAWATSADVLNSTSLPAPVPLTTVNVSFIYFAQSGRYFSSFYLQHCIVTHLFQRILASVLKLIWRECEKCATDGNDISDSSLLLLLSFLWRNHYFSIIIIINYYYYFNDDVYFKLSHSFTKRAWDSVFSFLLFEMTWAPVIGWGGSRAHCTDAWLVVWPAPFLELPISQIKLSDPFSFVDEEIENNWNWMV